MVEELVELDNKTLRKKNIRCHYKIMKLIFEQIFWNLYHSGFFQLLWEVIFLFQCFCLGISYKLFTYVCQISLAFILVKKILPEVGIP